MEAIILAGGLGTRLRGVIGEIPKCMAPIDGKPFLQYQLEWLSRFDISHVVFSVGYLKEQVIDFVNSREWPFEVSYAVETEPLGTGGGIRLALSKCRGNLVYVLNGDTFFAANAVFAERFLRNGYNRSDTVIPKEKNGRRLARLLP